MKGIHRTQTVLHTQTLVSLHPELLEEPCSIRAVVSVHP